MSAHAPTDDTMHDESGKHSSKQAHGAAPSEAQGSMAAHIIFLSKSSGHRNIVLLRVKVAGHELVHDVLGGSIGPSNLLNLL